MGKEKITRKIAPRHDPLGKQIVDSQNAHKVSRERTGKGMLKKKRNDINDEYVDETESVIPKQLSKKIMSAIREQQQEINDEEIEESILAKVAANSSRGSTTTQGERERQQSRLLSFQDDLEEEEDPSIYRDDEGDNEDNFDDFGNDDNERDFDEEIIEEIDAEDEKILSMFMNGHGGVGTKGGIRFTLGELIESKLKEQEAKTVDPKNQLDPKVVDVFTKVGLLLHSYTAGKIPRAFRILPNFANWEDLLYLTRPDKWSPNATFVATKLFCMGTNAKLTQRFLSIVLLPKIRDDIADHKKLNFHYYMALKKSLYRPQAFYKAILLPLAEGGDCTLLEAKIVASVVAKVSIPVLHSSVALIKLAGLTEYNGATSIFIRTLIDKKYSLPYRVIDALVRHFVSFNEERRQLPVLWHHSLLVFVQRFKNDIKTDQKEAIRTLLRHQTHHIITNEIRREIFPNNNISNNKGGDVTMSG
ncbi:hypothetical protein SAMD00019534_125870 [Acytostelium subglobosum LB1]|uniref:hypothetical protein n=1 Tax=Acytostelium subglobosum LB1 TaxID=1410327 RepID=UPI000644C189|nr:hypothetical protein SAMD00019534_125870 [Acytostelium subglobosum LB1]GAM29411.1 hypothetical protein SAMD00019534_125870 [Acytostelium subglobosum LB1]|eukprot:XP_012747637.1 hypothetical protein SAMD00019534_125870 [Acytostelium subglobosum LB1]